MARERITGGFTLNTGMPLQVLVTPLPVFRLFKLVQRIAHVPVSASALSLDDFVNQL
jgi:hypothetical protein